MGSFASSQNARNEESDIASSHMYKYPAKNGNYFSNYFIMGGEKFDTPQPEAYLFGDNLDLNFLGNRPVPFPYPAPQANDPTRPLRCLVNVRKESVRFVRCEEAVENSFNIEFVFDSDVRCAISIYYFCTEEVTAAGLIYHPKDEKLCSKTYYYSRGSNQLFTQLDHLFNPSLYPSEDLTYSADKDVIPVVIHCIALEGVDEGRQYHSTFAVIENHDGVYALKALKQKLFVDGLCYLLQEIYGIENKFDEANNEVNTEDGDNGGLECVICMCDMRDTLILPCRHLCLCQACADSLRYQANNCPICRSPFRALLHIKALQKYSGAAIAANEVSDGIPVEFKHASLVEALNGPAVITRRCSERMSNSLKLKANLRIRDLDNRDNECKDENALILCSKLACHDTEDEDKSSSITDHLLQDKSLVCSSPCAVQNETLDEDSKLEKDSPLLEVGISYDENGESKIEFTITDGNEEISTDESHSNTTSFSRKSSKSLREVVEKASDMPQDSIDNSPSRCQPVISTFELLSDPVEPCTGNSSCLGDSSDKDKYVTSQPSTPASVASVRSTDDSYSSSGSSRRLLSSSEKPDLV